MHGYANDLTSVQHLSFLYTRSKFYRDQRRTYIRVLLSKFAFLCLGILYTEYSQLMLQIFQIPWHFK